MGLSIRVGTRGSPLALWQAEWVKERLLSFDEVESVEILKIKTSGDKILDVPLAKVGGKGLFTKEIEEALLRNETDIAVHSLKDVPIKIPEGLEIKVFTERESPFDVLVSHGKSFHDLPKNGKIGTSSLRRRAQIKRHRPDLEIVEIRGNVQTRLKKLDSENLDGIILAAAGMIRMGTEERISQYLPTSICLPAVGQGVLAIETRIDDEKIKPLVGRLHHKATGLCVAAERGFLERLEGGCQVPIAAFATLTGSRLGIEGMVAGLDGEPHYRSVMAGEASKGRETGIRLAEKLLKEGAGKVLEEIYKG